ncbi:MAG: hypothetical protein JWN41_244 [Thermoleophilia bacterium]|nr:hypothetical protein [Thermoleophilia bacterium]
MTIAAPTMHAPALATAALLEFPGIVQGDVFDIVKGSKVGIFSPKGRAVVVQLEHDVAAFRVIAGAFGVNVDMTVSAERISDGQVQLVTTAPDGNVETVMCDIVATRTNYAEFCSTDGSNERTVISHDGYGGVTIDAIVPTFGTGHLVLQRHVT